jgi:hypothetical protein
MELKILIALIAAGTSIIGVLINVLLTLSLDRKRRSHEKELNKDVKRLEAHLANMNEERNARRDYEYEARKRLYAEVEPILFQLTELSEAAMHRVFSLARTASTEDLSDPETSWLGRHEYYFNSTLYHLIAPLAAVKLLQRTITFVDLSVERSIASEYALAKRLLITFTDDFEFARSDPALPYDSHFQLNKDERREDLLRNHPQIYRRQGVVLGEIESAAESFITTPTDSMPARVMSFGEVERSREESTSPVATALAKVQYVLEDFHPATRPVFWRILVTQACIYQSFVRLRDMKLGQVPKSGPFLQIPKQEERSAFDWRSNYDSASDDEVFNTPFKVAETYFKRHLSHLLSKPNEPA